MRLFSTFLLGLFLVAVVLWAGSTAAWSLLSPMETSPARDVQVEVPAGASSRDIARLLEQDGLIRNQLAFRLLAKALGSDGKLKAGEYELSSGMTAWEIIEKMERGEVVTYSLTIPEGFSVAQIRQKMASTKMIDPTDFDRIRKDFTLVADWVPESGHSAISEPLEGYLFPETYTLTSGTDASQLVREMINRFRSIWTEERLEKLKARGLSLHQAVTLASIVEREAQLSAERPLIAAVYLNRLKLQMKLDADPTVLYALKKKPGEPLYRRDLDVELPYNTYRYAGLPPGPIANPGLASIDAVLNPADVPYLYFVSRNDGSHAFATSYRDQQKNVAKYQP